MQHHGVAHCCRCWIDAVSRQQMAIGELTVRRLNSGGPIVEKLRWQVSNSARGSTTVVFVHGYNTDRSDARRNYECLIERLRKCGVAEPVLENVWFLYWPGDARHQPLSATIRFRSIDRPRLAPRRSLARWCSYLERFLSRRPRTVD